MNRVYRVVFLGLLEKEEYFKSRMSKMGISPDLVENIIEKAPVVLKESQSLEYIRKYAEAVYRAGGDVNIRACNAGDPVRDDSGDIPAMDEFTQCPQCGYKQIKNKTCTKCGFVLIRIS